MTVTLPGGYKITFNLHVSGGPVAATSFPTFTDAFLGNNGHYTGVSGRPALNQTTRGTTTTATLDGITVTGPGGVPETGYAFVGADAESTDRKESITWTANTPFTLLEPVGNACNSGSRLTGVGTKTVTCSASVSNTKTGTAMLAAQAPSSIAQEMVGGGHQGVAFGVLVSTVQLNKQVSSRIDPSDAFGISIRSLPSNDLLGSANTGTANTASTGPITVLTSDVGSSFTFAEQITSGLPSNYTESWSCTRNGASDPALPSGDIGSSATVTLGIGDFVDCTITNTSKPVRHRAAEERGGAHRRERQRPHRRRRHDRLHVHGDQHRRPAAVEHQRFRPDRRIDHVPGSDPRDRRLGDLHRGQRVHGHRGGRGGRVGHEHGHRERRAAGHDPPDQLAAIVD